MSCTLGQCYKPLICMSHVYFFCQSAPNLLPQQRHIPPNRFRLAVADDVYPVDVYIGGTGFAADRAVPRYISAVFVHFFAPAVVDRQAADQFQSLVGHHPEHVVHAVVVGREGVGDAQALRIAGREEDDPVNDRPFAAVGVGYNELVFHVAAVGGHGDVRAIRAVRVGGYPGVGDVAAGAVQHHRRSGRGDERVGIAQGGREEGRRVDAMHTVAAVRGGVGATHLAILREQRIEHEQGIALAEAETLLRQRARQHVEVLVNDAVAACGILQHVGIQPRHIGQVAEHIHRLAFAGNEAGQQGRIGQGYVHGRRRRLCAIVRESDGDGVSGRRSGRHRLLLRVRVIARVGRPLVGLTGGQGHQGGAFSLAYCRIVDADRDRRRAESQGENVLYGAITRFFLQG